jgi:superkiller protein 3
MSSKAALKEVRTALDSKNFELAADKAKALVKEHPQNYHAWVLITIAFESSANLLLIGMSSSVLRRINSIELMTPRKRIPRPLASKAMTRRHGRDL